MSYTYGKNIKITLFGQSHGEMIGATIDGLTSGIKIDEEFIALQMSKRKPMGELSTKRIEEDKVKIISGVFNGYTCGAPLTLLIENNNTRSSDYDLYSHIARPSTCDYTSSIKYKGFNDYRGSGPFSGRLTAPLVAIGAILIDILRKKDIIIGTHIKQTMTLKDREFANYSEDINYLNSASFPTLDVEVARDITNLILEVKKEGDSLGATLQTAVINLPAGVGEPFFDSLESTIAHLMFSIPAIKGVEFGLGFEMNKYKGSEVNDQYIIEDNKVSTKTNNNGGINAGISNGCPLLFNTVVKPTPSIYKEQNTIDFKENKEVKLIIKGRHDPAIFIRVPVIINSLLAIGLIDLLIDQFGKEYLL